MIKQFIVFLFIAVIATSSFGLDKDIEDALVANDWQKVYGLLIKENKYETDPIHNFLMVQSCFAVDCDLNFLNPNLDDKSFTKLSNWIEQFSSKNKNNIVAKHLQSELNHINGNLQRTIQYSIEITKEDSSFALAYNTRSNAFIEKGKYENALVALNHLIEQDSTHSKAYLNRGVIYDEMGNYRGALQDYEKAIELNPKFAMSYYNQGNTYRHLGNDSLAIVSFSKSIELDKKNIVAYYNRGNTYFDTKDFDNAKKDYENFEEKAPQEMIQLTSIVQNMLEYINNYDKNFDKEKIKLIIMNAYNAWTNKEWEKFVSYIHPQALAKFKEALMPMYQKIFKDKADDAYVVYHGRIISMKLIKKSTDKKFFEIETKILCANDSEFRDMFLLKKMYITSIEQQGSDFIGAFIKTEYYGGNKKDEVIGLKLDGNEWKLLLPESFMNLMLEMFEQYKK